MGMSESLDIKQIRDYLNAQTGKMVHRVIASLQYIGEEVVNQIRNSDISYWDDHTGNLRSSIGYIVSLDGQPIGMSGFEQVEGPQAEGAPADGGDKGEQYARHIATLYPQGISLIVVAGMEYASYVENIKSRTVLAQGEIVAKKMVSEMIQKLDKRYGKNDTD